ncbi:MAG: prepilin peptidase [Paracoccaceae bacterium]
MLGLSDQQVFLALFLAVLPVCAWVAWSDLKTMKIPNKAVIALLAVFFFVGLLVFPLDVWAIRWLSFAVILAIGFVLNAIANVGAGDAKFAAAAAPFFNPHALPLILPLFAACLLGAFAAHRLLRAIPAVRRMTPDWVSWTRKDFPMGLALVGTLLGYLALGAFPALSQGLIALLG